MNFLKQFSELTALEKEPIPDIRLVREKILSLMLNGLPVIGLPVAVLGSLKAVQEGYWFFTLIYAALYIIILFLVFFSGRIGFPAGARTFIGFFLFISLLIIFKTGFSTIGIELLIICCFTTTVLLGLRKGIYVFILSLVSTAAIAVLQVKGIIPVISGTVDTGITVITWVMTMIVFSGIVFLLLLTPWMLQASLFESLNAFKKNSTQLTQANIRLQEEIQNRIRTEKKLRKSEERYRDIIDAMEEIYFEIDLMGNFTFFNESICKISGYPPEEVMGRNNREYTTPETAKKMYRIFSEIYTTGKSRTIIDYEIIIRDGSTRIFELSTSLMRDSAGNPAGFRGVARDVTEKKQAEKAIRESEEKYRLITDNVSDIIWTMDTKYSFTYISPSIITQLGYTVDEIVDMDISDTFTPESYRQIEDEITNLYKTATSGNGFSDTVSIEILHIHKNGSHIPCEIKISLLLNSSNELTGFLGITRDISDRKKAEEKLSMQRNLLKSTIDSMYDMFFIKDTEGHFIECNPSFCNFMGIPRHEILGKKAGDLFMPEQTKKFIETDSIVLDITAYQVYEEWLTDTADNKRLFQTIKSPYYNHDGSVAGLVGISRDITERHNFEEEIRKNSEILRLITDNLRDSIRIIDLDSMTYTYANPYTEELFGISVDSYLGLHMGVNLDSTMNSIIRQRITDELENDSVRERNRSFTYELQEKNYQDNRTIWTESKSTFIRDESGCPINILVITRDITRNKQAEAELTSAKIRAEEADRLKSAFLANMSHEIRTPMNAIIGYTDLLLLEQLKEPCGEYLSIIRSSGNLLSSIIDDILDLSKIESDQLEIELVPASIERLFTNMSRNVEILNSRFSKNLSIKSEMPDEISRFILCDPTRIEQVMNNLLSNAVKFTDQGGITFGVKLENESELIFYVSDTGIGINPDYQVKIFERFNQADTSINRRYSGSGLGLTISRLLIKLMGGSIWLESNTGTDHGSTFSFSIPYMPAGKPAEDEVITAPPKNRKKSYTILVVEDNHINMLLTERLLKKFNYRVDTATNGLEGVKKYRENSSIDLILMDIQMPVMDGFEATGMIRKYEKTGETGKRVPIIALTAHAMKGDREKIIRAGCDNYISKPVNFITLDKVIKKHLKS